MQDGTEGQGWIGGNHRKVLVQLEGVALIFQDGVSTVEFRNDGNIHLATFGREGKHACILALETEQQVIHLQEALAPGFTVYPQRAGD